jgi:transposase
MVNPGRIKAFREAEGLIAKTDRLDAGLIARFAHVMAGVLRPLGDAGQAGLKALSTNRRQLTESIAIEKTRLKQAFDPLILDSCREMIGRRAILSSMPGMAARISTLVVIEMPELGEIGGTEAASLAGLAPHQSQSGLSLGRNAISGAPACPPPSTSPPSSRCEAIPGSSRSISTSAPQENPQRSPSSPSPAEWSASQTPSSATTSLSIKRSSLDPRQYSRQFLKSLPWSSAY